MKIVQRIGRRIIRMYTAIDGDSYQRASQPFPVPLDRHWPFSKSVPESGLERIVHFHAPL